MVPSVQQDVKESTSCLLGPRGAVYDQYIGPAHEASVASTLQTGTMGDTSQGMTIQAAAGHKRTWAASNAQVDENPSMSAGRKRRRDTMHGAVFPTYVPATSAAQKHVPQQPASVAADYDHIRAAANMAAADSNIAAECKALAALLAEMCAGAAADQMSFEVEVSPELAHLLAELVASEGVSTDANPGAGTGVGEGTGTGAGAVGERGMVNGPPVEDPDALNLTEADMEALAEDYLRNIRKLGRGRCMKPSLAMMQHKWHKETEGCDMKPRAPRAHSRLRPPSGQFMPRWQGPVPGSRDGFPKAPVTLGSMHLPHARQHPAVAVAAADSSVPADHFSAADSRTAGAAADMSAAPDAAATAEGSATPDMLLSECEALAALLELSGSVADALSYGDSVSVQPSGLCTELASAGVSTDTDACTEEDPWAEAWTEASKGTGARVYEGDGEVAGSHAGPGYDEASEAHYQSMAKSDLINVCKWGRGRCMELPLAIMRHKWHKETEGCDMKPRAPRAHSRLRPTSGQFMPRWQGPVPGSRDGFPKAPVSVSSTADSTRLPHMQQHPSSAAAPVSAAENSTAAGSSAAADSVNGGVIDDGFTAILADQFGVRANKQPHLRATTAAVLPEQAVAWDQVMDVPHAMSGTSQGSFSAGDSTGTGTASGAVVSAVLELDEDGDLPMGSYEEEERAYADAWRQKKCERLCKKDAKEQVRCVPRKDRSRCLSLALMQFKRHSTSPRPRRPRTSSHLCPPLADFMPRWQEDVPGPLDMLPRAPGAKRPAVHVVYPNQAEPTWGSESMEEVSTEACNDDDMDTASGGAYDDMEICTDKPAARNKRSRDEPDSVDYDTDAYSHHARRHKRKGASVRSPE